MEAVMSLHTDHTVLICAMLISGILIGNFAGDHGNWLTDFIAGIVTLFIIACMLVQFKVF